MENSHPDGGPGRPAAISEVNPLAWRPQQLQQLGDVGEDAPGLVAGEQLGRSSASRLLLEIDVGERLTVLVPDGEAGPPAPRLSTAAGSGVRRDNGDRAR
jgi:hypothetical protein